MNRYKTNVPRTAIALAAAALTALTIGVAIVLPARADVDRANEAALAAADRDARPPAAIAPALPRVDRIDVVAIRESGVSVPAHARYARHG
ncbi:MAG TPA: hypothetical protein VGV08_08500 [Casimicrobiaceae bacterium]|nr:hypothetical protein [Casimicrobiaceae bacterium]